MPAFYSSLDTVPVAPVFRLRVRRGFPAGSASYSSLACCSTARSHGVKRRRRQRMIFHSS